VLELGGSDAYLVLDTDDLVSGEDCFFVATGITDGEVRLKELVQDGAGDWTERSSTLQLIQADTKK